MRYLYLCLFIGLLLLTNEVASASPTDSLVYGHFGKVHIYKPKKTADAIILFVSGDGGWNQGPINMAKHIVDQGAMVVGINISEYLLSKMRQHEKCYYPAGDFEELSLYVQKKYKFRTYLKPILMGYSSGATLVYGILAQAPANTFKGAIAMGFCPDIATVEPLCTTNVLKQHTSKPGGVIWLLEPTDKLTAPFIVINGLDDKVCNYKNTEAFMKKINTGEFIGIPKVGHGMSVQRNYLPHLIYAFEKVKKSASYTDIITSKNKAYLVEKSEKPVTDLPLLVLPANRNDTLPLIFFISGVGGWTSFEHGISEKMTVKGFPVIGLDAQKYFWQARTPDEAAEQLSNALRHYLSLWNKKSFILCGNSFGADIIPFMVTRLSGDLRYMMKSAVMLNPELEADFEIKVSDMLSFGKRTEDFNVLTEVRKSTLSHVTCIFGDDVDQEITLWFKNAGANIKVLPGNLKYTTNYKAISDEIVNSVFKK